MSWFDDPAPATEPRPRPAARSATKPGSGVSPGKPRWSDYLADPRSAVLFFLASALVIGGGRRGLQAIRARRVVAALASANPDVADVVAAADHGRAALIDLFRLLGTADRPEVRDAAGRSLARLWRGDELVAEEEKAIVRRGFQATWRARRTYPRGLRVPIAITVDFGVPFLTLTPRSVGPSNLVWSHRVTGTEQARLETWTDPQPGAQSATFAVYPDDFATLGPHRLVLQTRVKTVGLTDTWDLELPHLPFAFEFDPNLTVSALLTLPDDARGAQVARAIQLVPEALGGEPGAGAFPLTADLVLRDPPAIQVAAPLPCDLAHRVALEVEGVPEVRQAGTLVAVAANLTGGQVLTIPLGSVDPFTTAEIDRPGPRRVRAILTADPELGWVNPDVRSIWPGVITTDWVEVRVIRR